MDVYSNLALPFLSSKTGNEWGAATLGYNYYLTNHISVGAQIVYSSSKTKIAETSYKNNYISIMPDVRYSWFNQSWFSLYSRVGAGVLIRHINYTEKIDSENDTKFAYQISPIGLDFGKTIIGFAEFGLGVSGTIIVGARYRF